jgi:hypothetical protein
MYGKWVISLATRQLVRIIVAEAGTPRVEGVSHVRLVRVLVGAVFWILAVVVGLVAAILCVTTILLPIGIPLLLLSRRLFGASTRQFLPRKVRHPLQEADKAARKEKPRTRRQTKKLRKSLPDLDVAAAKRKSRRFLKRRRKKLPVVG